MTIVGTKSVGWEVGDLVCDQISALHTDFEGLVWRQGALQGVHEGSSLASQSA